MIPGLLVATILTGLSFLHFYWAFGGRWGSLTALPDAGGEKLFHPGKKMTLFVATVLLLAAFIICGQIGLWGSILPSWIFFWGAQAVAGSFLLRGIGDFRYVGFFKRVQGTNFAYWDNRLYSPFCIMIVLLTVLASR